MLTRTQVQHIAKLARLGLTEKEEEKFRKELTSVLGYVEKLQEVDTSKVDPLSQVTGLENVMRPDEPKRRRPREVEKLLKGVPRKKERYVKVGAIL